MKNFCDFSKVELAEWCQGQDLPAFNAKQLQEWVYHKMVLDWDSMSNLSKANRQRFKEAFQLPALSSSETPLEGRQAEFLWKLFDEKTVSSQFIQGKGQKTAYISTQVGTPVHYAFLAGNPVFYRNLRPGEIVEQVLQLNKWLLPRSEKITAVSFSAGGEPLKNYEPCLKAMHMFQDRELFGISPKRIELNTVGIIDGIENLIRDAVTANLTVGLHAPNQKLRQSLIPYAKKYPLEDLLEVIGNYWKKTKAEVVYEYALLEGVNDHPDQALELAHLLKGSKATVKLLLLPAVKGGKFRPPQKKAIKQFRSVLFGSKIANDLEERESIE